MKPLREYISEDALEDLATRSNFRYGKGIAKDGEFTLVKSNTYNHIAQVKQGHHEKRTVHLESTPKGLRWKCTCTSKKNYFCQHCVAVGLAFIK
ncbi:MAG: hypothetical protein KW788_01210 [Candidatus Doudnabacteria bacterium]|nr:hypothetical protein [Candidatus Doudnabacteria bacterium]